MLISSELLNRSYKILYMTHLALGDFLYQKTFLNALKSRYPHLQLDVWTDSFKTKHRYWQQGRNNALEGWISNEDCINKVYPIVESAKELDNLISQAKKEDYNIIFFIAKFRTDLFARTARKISGTAYIAGTLTRPYHRLIRKKYYFSKLNAYYRYSEYQLPENGHITDIYNYHFWKITGVSLSKGERKPTLALPKTSLYSVKQYLYELKQKRKLSEQTKVLFINHLSTSKKRDWPIKKVLALIMILEQHLLDWLFMISAPPDNIDGLNAIIEKHHDLPKNKVVTFSARNDFFELPAMISICDYILSVETSAMHFAATLNVPLLALMRKENSPWKPLENGLTEILFSPNKNGWVDDIEMSTVQKVIQEKLENQI